MTRPIPLVLIITLGFTTAIYWPGLGGVFMLDDEANLAPIWRWLEGEIGWLQVVLGNESGPLGRPVAMLSFVLTAGLFGDSAIAFKAVNLSIHLAIGVVLFLFLSSLLRRDSVLGKHAAWYALAITAVWLLHPMLTSTVLYVVQRMAMLSALFVLLGLWGFIQGRLALETNRTWTGCVWLFIGIPAFTALAALSKESGLLLPLLCGILEWAYFSPIKGLKRPAPARWFLGIFILAPIAIGTVYLAANPSFFLDGYGNRPFSVTERLLTQARVLFDYTGSILLPVGQQFSLFRDDYMISTGLFQPMTTFGAIVGWLAIVVSAFCLRHAIPGFSAGIGIFLVGHAMESSFYPLFIYFEHRNYLPTVGILLAVASLLVYAGRRIQLQMDRPQLIFGGAFVGMMLALSFATYARSLAWQSPTYLLEQSIESYPDSRHARMEMASQLMKGPFPNHRGAIGQYRHLQTLDLPSTRMIGHLGEIALLCHATGQAPPEKLAQAFAEQPETIQADLIKTFETIADILRRQDCDGVRAADVARRLVRVADQSALSEGSLGVWRTRFEAARLFADQGLDEPALEQAERAWQTGRAELPVAVMIAGLRIRLEQYEAAREILDTIEPQVSESDRIGQNLLKDYRQAIEEREDASILQDILDE